MSVHVTSQIFLRTFGSAARKVVALKLGDCADDQGRGIWPSYKTVAAETDVSESTVRRIMGEFVESGLLVKVKNGGKGPRSTNRYDMDLTRLAVYPLAKTRLEKVVTMNTLEPEKGGHHEHLSDAEKVVKSDAKVVKSDAKVVTSEHQTIIEPSNNHHHRADAREPSMVVVDCEPEKGDAIGGAIGALDQEQRKALMLAWAHWDGKLAGSENYLEQQASELAPDEFARAVDVQRIDAYRAAEADQGLTRLKHFGAYLRDRKFDCDMVADVLARKAAKETEAARRQMLAQYGKAWMAWRLARLAAGDVIASWKPATSFLRSCWEDPARSHLLENHRRRDIDRAIDDEWRRQVADLPAHEDYVQIARDSEEWREWAAWHEARQWPWIDPPEHIRFVWVPAAMPRLWTEAP